MITISFEATDEPTRLTVTERIPYSLDKVWLAQTEALYVQQWWAPAGYQNDEVELTAEVGGTWRVIQRDPEGNQFSFYGRVEDIAPQELLVLTLTSEVFPETTLRLTQQFAGSGVGTLVVSTYEFPSQGALNSYLAIGGMERLRDASAKLDTLLSHMAE